LGSFGTSGRDGTFFLLVVLDCGGYYERVGCYTGRLNVKHLIEHEMKKTRVRIG
jgi:hypothetical protein